MLVGLLRLFRVPWPPTIDDLAPARTRRRVRLHRHRARCIEKYHRAGDGRRRARHHLVLHGVHPRARLFRPPGREQTLRQTGAEPGADAGAAAGANRRDHHRLRPRRAARLGDAHAAQGRHIIVESDPQASSPAVAERDWPVYFGDAKSGPFLKACGIATAKGVVITVNRPAVADDDCHEPQGAARRHRHRRARRR